MLEFLLCPLMTNPSHNNSSKDELYTKNFPLPLASKRFRQDNSSNLDTLFISPLEIACSTPRLTLLNSNSSSVDTSSRSSSEMSDLWFTSWTWHEDKNGNQLKSYRIFQFILGFLLSFSGIFRKSGFPDFSLGSWILQCKKDWVRFLSLERTNRSRASIQ